MRTDVLKALIQNSTILVVAFLFVTRFSRWKMLETRTRGNLIQGIAYAFCGILAIMFSVEVLPGVLIDMRTPIIVTAALTGGSVVGLITISPLLVYRVFLGGTGMNAGIGIIVTAFAFGLILRSFERRTQKPGNIAFQLGTGVGSAVIYYIWILTLPGGIALTVLKETFIPLTVGSVISILAIFIIRKRELAHQELVENLSEINDLFEEISLDENIGITVIQDGRIVFVNSSLLSKFGFNRFDPDNSDLMAVISPAHRDGVMEFLKQVEGEQNLDSVSLELAPTGSAPLHFLVHARKLLYRGLPSILVVSVDITRLVHTELMLKDRIDQLQLSLDASGAVLWKADLAKNLLQADHDFFTLLRYIPGEKIPAFSKWLDAMTLPGEMTTALAELRAGKRESIFGEVSLKGSDGKLRWFNTGARVTHVNGQGSPVELTGILFETTAIKEKELELLEKEIEDLQSQKMETIGRLAGGVAHDFNNLLHVIMGYTEILKKVAENDPVTGDLTDPILDAARKGRELVRQLLLFSRNKTPELKAVDLSTVTGNFLNLLRRIIEENIVITSEISSDPPLVMGDTGQIEQVLMNLCINSRDAMPGGGTISIRLSRYTSSEQQKTVTGILDPGDYALLSVCDSGPGIPKEDHRSIFEPFFTTKQVDKGTGLGLSTVLGIMESHSGVVDVRNVAAGGLEILLFFPATENSEQVESSGYHTTYRSSNLQLDALTVLVAEDDPQVMNLTVEGLGAAGIRVLRAANGREAVEVFNEKPDEVDLLVFDVVMPILSGPDAYREIASSRPDIPVVFTTGYAGGRMIGLTGDYRIVYKPYAVVDLVSVIRDITMKGGS